MRGYWIAVFLVILTTCIVSPAMATKSSGADRVGPLKQRCIQQRYKVGDHIFTLPPEIPLLDATRKGDEPARDCRKPSPDGQPANVSVLKFFLPYSLAYWPQERTIEQAKGAITEGNQDTYDFAVEKGWIKKDLKLEDLPKIGGFYQYYYLGSFFLLISADPHFKTPSGNPVTFECRYGYSKAPRDHSICNTSIAWHDIRFFLSDIDSRGMAIEEMKDFYIRVFSALENLEEKQPISKENAKP